MTSNLKDLEEIGFEHIGHWLLQADDPHYVLHRRGDAAPALWDATFKSVPLLGLSAAMGNGAVS